MFYYKNNIWKSSLLDGERVGHGFSSREGGVSTLAHTRTMNLGFERGDSDDSVRANMRLLCMYAGVSYGGLVGSAQFHSDTVRYVDMSNAHEGIDRESISFSDGFVTDVKGVSLIVRMADCTPILFSGAKKDGSPVVAAVHAGWRGTVAGIGANAVCEMERLGAQASEIKAAIGHCIHRCHFEVKEDFLESVAQMRGEAFALRHIRKEKDGRMYADMVAMNREILLSAGICEENLDISPKCTVCEPQSFHSHRATGGNRGTMGAVIGIKP